MAELAPALLSVEWTPSQNMEMKTCNVLLAGSFQHHWSSIPEGMSHVASHSSGDIYDVSGREGRNTS